MVTSIMSVGGGAIVVAPISLPHFMQNLVPSAASAPHFLQNGIVFHRILFWFRMYISVDF